MKKHAAVCMEWVASGRPDEIVHNEQVRQVYLGEHFRL